MLELRDEFLPNFFIKRWWLRTILEMQCNPVGARNFTINVSVHSSYLVFIILANDCLKNTDLIRKHKIMWQENSINIEEDQMFIEGFLDGQEYERSLERQMAE